MTCTGEYRTPAARRHRPRRDAAVRSVAVSRAVPPASAPGVVAVDAAGRLTHRSEDAARHLDDLAAETPVLARLLRRHTRRAAAAPETTAPAQKDSSSHPAPVVRARGRSGRWYALHAVTAEPGAWRDASTVVVIAPADAADAEAAAIASSPPPPPDEASVAATLAERYGLSPRERDVLLRVARGESTKAAAAALGLSPFTVQDYVRRACEKVGVRTRKELIAKIFVTG